MGSVVVAPGLWSIDTNVVVQGLICSKAPGIFQDQGLNPCLQLWQVDSLPPSCLGSPIRPHYLRGFSDTLNEQFTSPGRGLGNIFCMDGQAHQRGTASCWLDQRTLGLVKHRSLYGRHLDRGLLWLQPGSTHAVVLVR